MSTVNHFKGNSNKNIQNDKISIDTKEYPFVINREYLFTNDKEYISITGEEYLSLREQLKKLDKLNNSNGQIIISLENHLKRQIKINTDLLNKQKILENELKNKESNNQSSKHVISSFQKQLTAKDNDIKDLKEQIKIINNEYNNINNEYNNMLFDKGVEIQNLVNSNKIMVDNNFKLKKNLDSKMKKINTLTQQLLNTENQYNISSDSYSETQKLLDDYKNKLIEKDNEIMKKYEQINNLDRTIKDYSDNISTKNKKINYYENEIKELSGKIIILENENILNEQIIVCLKSQLNENITIEKKLENIDKKFDNLSNVIENNARLSNYISKIEKILESDKNKIANSINSNYF
mgnify:CR=1 FL=1